MCRPVVCSVVTCWTVVVSIWRLTVTSMPYFALNFAAKSASDVGLWLE